MIYEFALSINKLFRIGTMVGIEMGVSVFNQMCQADEYDDEIKEEINSVVLGKIREPNGH